MHTSILGKGYIRSKLESTIHLYMMGLMSVKTLV